jgi:hypothetical protein
LSVLLSEQRTLLFAHSHLLENFHVILSIEAAFGRVLLGVLLSGAVLRVGDDSTEEKPENWGKKASNFISVIIDFLLVE